MKTLPSVCWLIGMPFLSYSAATPLTGPTSVAAPAVIFVNQEAAAGAAAAEKCDLKAEILKTQTELVGVRKNFTQLRRQITQLTEQRDSLAKKLATADKKAAEETQRRAELEKRHQDCDRRIAELEKALTDLQAKDAADLAALAQELGDSEEQVDTLQKQLTEQAGEAKELITTNKKLAAEMQKAIDAAGKNRGAMESLTRLERQTADWKKQLADAKRATAKATADSKALVGLKEENAKLSKELASAWEVAKKQPDQKAKLADLDKRLAALGAERDALTKKLDASAAAAERKAAEQRILSKRLLADAEARSNELNKRLSASNLDAKNAKEIADKGRAAIVTLQVERKQLTTRIADLEKRLTAAKPAPVAAKPVASDKPLVISTLYFDTNATGTLRDDALVLKQVTEILKKNPATRFEVVGHTCNTGSQRANQNLSSGRAESVAEMLVKGGVPEKSITTRGVAEKEPIADNATLEGRRLNRRVEVREVK